MPEQERRHHEAEGDNAPLPGREQRLEEEGATQGRGGRLYVEVLTGKKVTPRPEEWQPEKHKGDPTKEDGHEGGMERPWTKVCRKKRQRTPPVAESSRRPPDKNTHMRLRHSPPRKRTSSGVIEVCGRCRQPGHLMIDCRRVEVCRRCERPGHREKKCPRPPPKLGTIQLRGLRQMGTNAGKMKKKRHAITADLPGTEARGGASKDDSVIPPDREAPAEEETHHASLSVDTVMMAEREELQRCSIATVVKMTGCLASPLKVTAAAAEMFGPDLKWSAEPYEDDRILLHCPSEKIAREMEKIGEVTFPGFIVRFEPWTLDSDFSVKAEGEIRWLTGKGLPMFGRKIDTIARILKPIGELVHLGSREACFAGHFRAMVRLRRGRRFPATIHCSILRRKYFVRVELEHGQSPLPWNQAPENNRVKGGAGEAAADERLWKGKSPIEPLGNDRDVAQRRTRPEVHEGEPTHATCSGAASRVRRPLDDRGGTSDGTSRQIKGGDAAHVDGVNGKSTTIEQGKREGLVAISLDAREKWDPKIPYSSKTTCLDALEEGHVLQPHAKRFQLPPRLAASTTSHGHLALIDEVVQISSHHEGSCDTATWQASKEHENPIFTSNEDSNDNLIKPITTYSESEKTKLNMDDVDTDEEYLNPELEREIELEFEGLWNSQLGGEESKQYDYSDDKSTGDDLVENTLVSPLTEPPGGEPPSMERPIHTASPIYEHEDGNKEPNPEERSPHGDPPDTQPYTPESLKGKEPTIHGLQPDIDLSNHSWKFINGSWNFMANSAWEGIIARNTLVGQGAREEDREDIANKEGTEHGHKHKAAMAPPKEAIRRSGRARKLITDRLEKEGFIAPSTSKRKHHVKDCKREIL
ncbi:hypothetical protein J5N97_024509 [Dioscorea zingiberensis]|uniref:CCHC-type domain-containing protein n=1 Tax=Dioscorea zingiberensis TaxID=325984 RepID=A0A9D5H8Z1_9LILI|nr:hypothetical protein J5N97_024509 [Dioscorea zingiberensis]